MRLYRVVIAYVGIMLLLVLTLLLPFFLEQPKTMTVSRYIPATQTFVINDPSFQEPRASAKDEGNYFVDYSSSGTFEYHRRSNRESGSSVRYVGQEGSSHGRRRSDDDSDDDNEDDDGSENTNNVGAAVIQTIVLSASSTNQSASSINESSDTSGSTNISSSNSTSGSGANTSSDTQDSSNNTSNTTVCETVESGSPLVTTPTNFMVAFIGDTSYGDNFERVLQMIRDEGADLVLHQGDLGYNEGDGEAPQEWLDVIASVLDSGGIFPYFFSIGNHDVHHWEDAGGYRDILEDRFAAFAIDYVGLPQDLGARTNFVYNGLSIVFVAPGIDADFISADNYPVFLDEQLGQSNSLWKICSWHKNMRAMQAGGKGDETGWEVYETCREHGAIIATAHEHSYSRTHVLSDMSAQVIADTTSPYTLRPGQTFAFVSGLGGASIRDQEIFASYFASVYTSDQDANYGALFIEFNVDSDPRKARGYFKNIDGEIVDTFELENEAGTELICETPSNTSSGGDNITNVTDDVSYGFVSADGAQLMFDGEEFRFTGINVYGAANDQDVYDCGPTADHGENADVFVEEMFSFLGSRGINVLRFWAFQTFTDGGEDFTALDRVVSYANQHGFKLIPVLENHWDDCTEGGEKDASWYYNGYLQPYGSYPLSYRDYVERVVTRYQNSTAILMWQLMNEAESNDAESLYNFTRDMSAFIKSLDSNHLVSLGTLGTGQAGTTNEDFVALHSLPTINVVEAHDYHRETEALPSSGSNSIARALNVANSLNKPFFIGEAGIQSDCSGEGCYSRGERADLFDAKLNATFANGGDGYLIWIWDNRAEHGGSSCEELGTYCFTEDDPLVDVLRRYS